MMQVNASKAGPRRASTSGRTTEWRSSCDPGPGRPGVPRVTTPDRCATTPNTTFRVEAMSELGFTTRAVHAGYDPDPQTGAVNVPIYASSTFAQDGVGGLRDGYEYARTGNPTRTVLEANLAALESGRYGRAYASGMAATDCALRAMLRPGDHIVIPDDAYGGTFRLIDKVFTGWGDQLYGGRRRRYRCDARRHPAGNEADLGGNAHQPAAQYR